MREKDFRGQIGVVSEWARRGRLAEKADQSTLVRTTSTRSIAGLMTLARGDLSKSDVVLVGAIESNVPDLTTARMLIDNFQKMILSKAVANLDNWLTNAKASLVGSSANGVEKYKHRSQRYRLSVVEWPDRRPDQQTQTHQAADVRPCQDRSAPSASRRRNLSQRCSDFASDPLLRESVGSRFHGY